jgi:hypothetical protein
MWTAFIGTCIVLIDGALSALFIGVVLYSDKITAWAKSRLKR